MIEDEDIDGQELEQIRKNPVPIPRRGQLLSPVPDAKVDYFQNSGDVQDRMDGADQGEEGARVGQDVQEGSDAQDGAQDDQNGEEAQDLLTYYPVHGSEKDEDNAPRRYPQRERQAPSLYTPGSAKSPRVLSMKGASLLEPLTVEEALRSADASQWKAAIDSELSSLRKHGTWEVVRQLEGVKTLSTRFVFNRKRSETGEVIRYKARLVVRGFLQGNVDQTFAPVVDFATVRTCLTVVVQSGYCIQQIDVCTAFLHGNNGEVYIKAPTGLNLCEQGQVLKLHRGLHGLKQAPRLWHDKWESVMKALGFVGLMSDGCVYRRRRVWLLLYVDDILLIGDDEVEVLKVKRELGRHLDVKDSGELRSF